MYFINIHELLQERRVAVLFDMLRFNRVFTRLCVVHHLFLDATSHYANTTKHLPI